MLTMWFPKSEHRSPDELIDFIARTRALNTSPFAKAGPERPFRLATAFCDGSLVYTFHQTREAAEEAYEALVAHYGGIGGDVWGATTNALRSWIALDYGGEVEEMITPVLWTAKDEQEVLWTSEDEQEVKAA